MVYLTDMKKYPKESENTGHGNGIWGGKPEGGKVRAGGTRRKTVKTGMTGENGNTQRTGNPRIGKNTIKGMEKCGSIWQMGMPIPRTGGKNGMWVGPKRHGERRVANKNRKTQNGKTGTL